MSSFSEIIIKSENEMQKLGKFLSKIFKPYDIITLNGDVGVGKTFLSKSIIYNITKIKEVPSPTFNLVLTYPINNIEIWHCDFYRINHFEEVEEIGVFEDLKDKIILLEWPKFKDEIKYLNPLNIFIDFVYNEEKNVIYSRKVRFNGSNEWMARIDNIFTLNLE